MAITMGQAIDAALEFHCKHYPDSDVYNAEVYDDLDKAGCWCVTIDTDDLGTVIYSVDRHASENAVTMV